MRSILMPTETINRDLDFQVLLAARAVRSGVQVYLGRLDAMKRVAQEVTGGIYIGKAFDPFFPDVDTSFYRSMKDRGFVVLHLDDEGAVFPGDEAEWIRTLEMRIDPAQITPDDYVCTWGDWQRDFYRSRGAPTPANVRTTGHPRFDFLSSPKLRDYYRPAATRLKECYGDYVLLNTNLQIANNGLGLKHTFTKRFGYDVTDRVKKTNAVDFWVHTTKLLLNLVKLAHRLADEFPKLRVVVRPHPSEDQAWYRTVFSGVGNVSVIHEGSVIPWLLASRALIHDGCTTGIEAALAGVPIVNYRSIEDARWDVYLPNLFGRKCTHEDEAVSAVRDVLEGRTSAPPREALPIRAEDRALLKNFEADDTFERLLAIVDEATAAQSKTSERLLQIRARESAARALEHAKAVARLVIPRGRVERAYSHIKFYGFSNARMEERIMNAERVTGRRLKLKIHTDNLLSLSEG